MTLADELLAQLGDTPPPGADNDWPEPIPLGEHNDPPPFPIETLPAYAQHMCCAVADELQAPVDMPAAMFLAVLAIARGGKDFVQVVNTWQEPVNLFLVVSMPPSAGKSPVVSKMLSPIYSWEQRQRQDAAERQAHVEQKRRIIEKKMRKAEDSGDITAAQQYLDELNNTPIPMATRLVADDATPEALAVLLDEQQGRIALVSTEGGPFEIMAGRYSERANLDVYLKAWSGDPVTVDRIGRPAIYVARPALTMALTVQPQVIESIGARPDFKGRGMTARIMYFLPVDHVGYRDLTRLAGINPGILDDYQRHIHRLLDATPTTVELEPAARAQFVTWRQHLEERRRPDGDLRPISEWSTKMESSVLRTAALLATADGKYTVDVPTMNRAVAIGTYWLAHAKIAHDMWGTDDRIVQARKILDWARLRQLEEFTVRDVYASLRSLFPTAEDAVMPLRILTERGWLRPHFEGPIVVGARGKPSPRFSVHPQNLWITASHARHARHVPRREFQVSSSSFSESPNSLHNAHDAHDAHDLDPLF